MVGQIVRQDSASRQAAPKIIGLPQLATFPFEFVPPSMKRKVYGARYVELKDTTGGRLWVTRHGWRHLSDLCPSRWYAHRSYSRLGRRLSDGSGAVYQFGDPGVGSDVIPLVVKFSRFGQDVQFQRCTQLSGSIAPHRLNDLAFNDPFQEFGMLDELRRGEYGPRNLRILTKRPLAIYSPGRTFNAWQLGRATHRFLRYRSQMDIDQKSQRWPLADGAFSIERQYVMLFHWVRGTDAESLVRRGLLSTGEAAALVRTVNEDLARKGFCMLDLKPNHVILRTHGDGRLVRRGRRPLYALVDFELLLRTEDHERWRTQRYADTRDWLRLPAQPVMNSAAATVGLA